MIEGLALVEPAHLQHPVDCLAIAAESKLRTASHNRDKAEIKLRRERPIGFDLCLQRCLAQRERREIQKRKLHGALDLVGVLAGEKHCGRVSVDARHFRAAKCRRVGEQIERSLLGRMFQS